MKKIGKNFAVLVWIAWAGAAVGVESASAHCDTMAGPVVVEAMEALRKGEVTPVLKWVRQQDEEEVKKAFRQAQRGLRLDPPAKARAERIFLETLVRLHRSSESEPFTGLKGADTPLEAGVKESDDAIQKGSVEPLVGDLAQEVSGMVRKKFDRVLRTKKHAEVSVEKGREYVAAYVDFVHTVERLKALMGGDKGHHPSDPHGGHSDHPEAGE